jgi:serine/threonine protein kinase
MLETVAASSAAPFASNVNSREMAVLGQRYEVLAEAGHGAMGQVFKARDRETREIVALKILKPEIASDPAMVERFKSELLFARKITHKNVCRVYEFNRVDGIAFTSMEFVDGESLRSVLKRFGNVTLRKGIDMALQMCSGLKEAHSQGIVHRDLKPENVMIDTHGNVKIMDFGIARSMETLTLSTGGLVGTPAYMAPEQAAGKSVDHRADVYAMGLMLYEMFTGSQVFRADNAVAVALKHIAEAPKPPREIEPSISPSLERTILKCLEKNPDQRFQSIAELESDLRPGVSGAGTGDTTVASTSAARELGPTAAVVAPSTPSAPEGAPASKSKRWVALGSLAVIAVAAVGARTLMNHGSGNTPAIVKSDGNVEIHSPQGSVSITPDSFSIEKKGPGKNDSISVKETPAGVVVHKGQTLVTSSQPKSQPQSQPKGHAMMRAEQTQPAAPPASTPSTSLAKSEASPSAPPSSAVTAPAAPAPQNTAASAENGTTDDTVPDPTPPGKGGYVWVGRYARQVGAQNASNRIEKMGLPVTIMPRRHPDQTEFFVVVSGPYSAAKIDGIVEQLKTNGFALAHPNRPVAGASKNGERGQKLPAP